VDRGSLPAVDRGDAGTVLVGDETSADDARTESCASDLLTSDNDVVDGEAAVTSLERGGGAAWMPHDRHEHEAVGRPRHLGDLVRLDVDRSQSGVRGWRCDAGRAARFGDGNEQAV
jgi:hypothetical protein